MMWVYFLKENQKYFENLCNLKFFVKKQSSGKLKMLRIDRREEFASGEFQVLCKAYGIGKEPTARYTPQQNEVA